MPFENVSKRRLAFAPKTVVVGPGQEDFSIEAHEISFAHTQRIVATNKTVRMVSSGKPGEFEKLPELAQIEGHFSLPEGITVLASKLTRIEGDLHVMGGARFYAPLLEEVTGFIYLEDGATVNAPKIEHMLSNDDASKIMEKTGTDWLDSL